MKRFLAINEYILHSSELKAIDRIIIAKIDEFARAKAQCYMTNEAFAELTGESVSTVKRALDRLEENGWIKRVTTTVTKDGRVAKQRVIYRKPKVQNEPPRRFKSAENEVQNEPIKEKEKINIKDNILLVQNEPSVERMRQEYEIRQIMKGSK